MTNDASQEEQDYCELCAYRKSIYDSIMTAWQTMSPATIYFRMHVAFGDGDYKYQRLGAINEAFRLFRNDLTREMSACACGEYSWIHCEGV